MANEFVIRRGVQSLGGVKLPYVSINNLDYTISASTDYFVEVVASSAQKRVTLPSPVEGQNFIIKNNYESSYKVVVDTTSGTIDGESTVTLSPGESLQVTTDGTNWTSVYETGKSLGAGCYETDLSTISGSDTAPNTNEITVWNQVGATFVLLVNKTQNGIDIESLLLSFESNAGLITITDSSDNFCSFTPQSITTGSTYVGFGENNSSVIGTLPENMDLGSAVICFTPASNGTSGSSGSSGSSGTSGSSGSSGTSGSSGSSGTSGSSGSSGTSGSSGSSGTSGSSGSSGTSGSSGEGICNEYRYNTGSGAASGQVVFDSSNDKLYITSSNSDSIDWSEYYQEIVTETLGGTVTLTKVNDTDTYVVFDIDPSTTTYVGGGTPHISIGLSTTYGGADGIVASNGTLTAASDNVCVSFDLFRRKKDIVSPNTPTGGVVVATSDAEQPAASSNIVITGDNITMTGVTYVQTKTQTGINGTNTSWYTVPKANTRGMIIEYVISRTDSPGYRMGQIMATWDDSAAVSFTDVSTKDVPGGASTSDCSVKVTGNAANAIIGIEVASGTYTVTVYVRALGTYS